MSYIAAEPVPYHDELFFSWLMRMVDKSGLSLPTFAYAYMGYKGKSPSCRIAYDVKKEFLPLYQHQYLFHNIKDMILQTTTFQFESMFLTDGEQTRYVNALTRPIDKLNAKGTTLFTSPRICPECFREDPEPYLHRVHQLSGVSVCPKHHTLLMEPSNPRADLFEFNLSGFVPCSTESKISFDSMNAYAQYVNELYSAALSTNVDHLKNIIIQRLGEYGCSSRKGYAAVDARFQAWEHKALLGRTLTDWIKHRFYKFKRAQTPEIITVLMFLFPDPQVLIKAIKERSEGYTLFGEYSCDQCGTTYYATPKAEHDGWGCPTCASKIPESERYLRLLKNATDGEYESMGSYQSNMTRIMHKHIPCGKEHLVFPSEMLFGECTCRCKTWTDEAHAKQNVEQNEGFTLISFAGKNGLATIKHEPCGRTFEMIYDSFRQHPRCPYCKENNALERARNTFVTRIAELTGDEYTLKTYSSWKDAEIVHNECGKSYHYSLKNFSNGGRCPYCRENLPVSLLNELLEKASDGVYTIADRRNAYCIVRNTVSGETKEMSTIYIQQEIFRPTPSDVLPQIKGPLPKDIIITSWDSGFQAYCAYVKEYGAAPTSTEAGKEYHGIDVYQWCKTQRRSNTMGSITTAHKKLLDEVGFDWAPKKSRWDATYELYKQYIAETGTTLIAAEAKYKQFCLGNWVRMQRKNGLEGRLTEERWNKLLALDSDFFAVDRPDILAENWTKNYEAYKRYVAETGSTWVSPSTVFEGYKIGYWLRDQRRRKKTGAMTEAQERLILEIDKDFFSKKQGGQNSPSCNFIFNRVI